MWETPWQLHFSAFSGKAVVKLNANKICPVQKAEGEVIWLDKDTYLCICLSVQQYDFVIVFIFS